MAVILTTNLGAIKIELDAEKAPKTVANFIAYVESGHYAGTIFIASSMALWFKVAASNPAWNKKHKAPIENEANNGLKNQRYSIAMARTGAPHSASAQFFINTANNSF